MAGQKFFSEYRKLNKEQKEAVDAIEGPVMVIAGPGTGKTQILTLRIANILRKTDADPESILALTFTEAAAANMRRRLVSIIGSRGYYVHIATFHGFANSLISSHPERFGNIIGFSNASVVDQIDIIRSILESGSFSRLKPFGDPYFYANDIVAGVRDLKKESISYVHFQKELARRAREFNDRDDVSHTSGPYRGHMKTKFQRELREIGKLKELARIYKSYESELRSKKFYDFEDMLLGAIEALGRDKDFLLELQERYQYFLVDEHQDTNGAQNKILELLSSFFPNPNLFVVGDEKQAIFRFQGASIDNFLYFRDIYPDVRLISLTRNYRSTQLILDAAGSLIKKNKTRVLSPPLSSDAADEGAKIQVCHVRDEEEEILFLADSIRERIACGIPSEEIAVLYRENRDAEPVADLFERVGVPFIVESNRDILADRDIRKLNAVFEAVGGFGSDEKLVKALHIDFWGIPPLDLYNAMRAAKGRKETLHAFFEDGSAVRALSLKDAKNLRRLYGRLRSWRTLSHNTDFPHFFETVVRESGFLNHLLSLPHRMEKLGLLTTLFDEIRRIVENHRDYGLRDYLYYLTILRDHGVSMKKPFSRSMSAVRLMTAHKAKGLEFSYVYIIGAYDGHWGNKRAVNRFSLPARIRIDSSEIEKNEDERRLFYMALTRARNEVCITVPRFARDGRERVPSQFLGEMRRDLVEEQEVAVGEERPEKAKSIFFVPRGGGKSPDDKEFVSKLLAEQGLSPTALNNYLACPWRYYFVNLVRIPFARSRSQMYGIAVHAALEDFFNARKRGEDAGAEFLSSRFIFHLGKSPLDERTHEELGRRGAETLSAYYRFWSERWNYNTENEYRIRGVLLRPGVTLTGKLDKLELEEGSQDVVVVDYKTKKPQSRNWIEGKTKNSDGGFKRQLVFYRLLLDLVPHSRYIMRAGAIDFVEPNDRGAFKRETFEVGDDEVRDLGECIRNTAREIMEISFWNKRCGDSKCEYCALREMMK